MNLRMLQTAGLLAIASAAAADQVYISASRDNTLFESSLGDLSNGAGPAVFAGHTNIGLKRRALMKFDIAGSVPPGSTITSVSLTLHLSMTISQDRDVSLHRLNRDWGEGASTAQGMGGRGTAAEPGDATWIHTFYPGQPWAQPGAEAGVEYEAVPSATTAVGNPLTYYVWSSTPALIADVQGWLDAPANNFGWLIIGDETDIGTAKRFDSRESPDPSVRPFLSVTFTPPCYPNCDGSSGTPILTANDFQCFLNSFAGSEPYANCDASTGTPTLTANDFQCFLNSFAAGCT